MARSKALTDLGDTDLLERLADSKEELFNLRFQNATGQLDNTSRLTTVKRDVARVLTELRAREIADAEALEAEEDADDSYADDSEVADDSYADDSYADDSEVADS
jgi:large subunit ribosomal protein L29